MKRNGFVIIYVLIVMIPVMIISMALLDLTSTDCITNINIVNKAQTYYNSETGMLDGLKRYKNITYNRYNKSVYYLDFNNNQILFRVSQPSSMDYVKVEISYTNLDSKRNYNIKAIGIYKGGIRDTEKLITTEVE